MTYHVRSTIGDDWTDIQRLDAAEDNSKMLTATEARELKPGVELVNTAYIDMRDRAHPMDCEPRHGRTGGTQSHRQAGHAGATGVHHTAEPRPLGDGAGPAAAASPGPQAGGGMSGPRDVVCSSRDYMGILREFTRHKWGKPGGIFDGECERCGAARPEPKTTKGDS